MAQRPQREQRRSEEPAGQIYDLGYRPYGGPYTARWAAIAGLMWEDLRRALGAGKSGKYKVLVLLVLLIELGVFLFFLLTSQVADAFGGGPGIPSWLLNPFSGFYSSIGLVMLLLSALIVPDLVCNDRRYRVYPLYLARPIYVHEYRLMKGLAGIGGLTLFALGPALLLFVGKAFLAPDALQYTREHLRDLGALLAAGPLFGVFYGSLALGLSSLTPSRTYAAGAIIGLVFLLGLVSGMLLLLVGERWVLLLDVEDYVHQVKNALFGLLEPIEVSVEVTLEDDVVREEGVRLEPYSPWVYGLGTALVIAVSWAVAWLRFRKEALE